jgi:hypothetical protein
MDSITARVQGETDWLVFSYEIKELNGLKDASLSLASISNQIGKLLDGSNIDEISKEAKENVKNLLATYIANTNSYLKMLETERKTIFITFFRRRNIANHYIARIAGILRELIENFRAVDTNNPSHKFEDIGHLIFLKVLNSNPNYSKDQYATSSIFKILKKQSEQMAGKIEIINTIDPQIN